MRKNLVQIGKFIISICLLVWFFTLVDLSTVLEIFRQASPYPLSLAFLTMLAGLLVSVYKWRGLLRSDGVSASMTNLVRYYLIGIYFNNFLPTSVGGDAMRAWMVSQRYQRGMTAISSVLAERFSGLLALLLVAGACSLGGEIFPLQNLLGIGMLLAVASVWLLTKRVDKRLSLTALPSWYREKTLELFAALHRYCTDRQALWTMMWTSLIYPFLVGLVYLLACKAIAIEVSFYHLVVVTSFVTLLTMVPISFNGLGLREGGFVVFLGLLGITKAQALSLSLMVFGLTLIFSFAGAMCFLFENKKKV